VAVAADTADAAAGGVPADAAVEGSITRRQVLDGI
jgi:hypothetical protein